MTDDNNEEIEKDVAPEHEHLIGNDHAVGNNGGAPKGNDNAVGSSGGSPAPNNQNAAKHHLRSDPDKLLKWLEREKPEEYQWVRDKYTSYLQDAPFDSESAKADKLLETVVCEYVIWINRGIQVRDGVTAKTHIKGSDGELVEVEDEIPNNQAVNRMDRQVLSKLKSLGVLDNDPDARAADAMERLASDDYVIDLGEANTDDE